MRTPWRALKKALPISGLLLALTASVASAGGINLSWSNCVQGGGAGYATFACDANTGVAGTLFASFEPHVTQRVRAFEFMIDIQAAGTALPEWWKFKAAGTCRQASMTMNTNFAAGPFDCVDPWGGTVELQDFSYVVGSNVFGGPSTARTWGFGAVPAGGEVPVDVGSEYYAFTLTINGEKTVGTGSCAGCLDLVCLVFNELTLYNETGVKTILSGPASVESNYVTWQGGDRFLCVTPTSKATWGKIKSIYR